MTAAAAGTAPALAAEAPAEEATPALLAAYNQWLFYERRMLCLEMFPGNFKRATLAEGLVPINTAADDFHVPRDGRTWQDVPPPSTRAASILRALGIDWMTDDRRDSGVPGFVYGRFERAAVDVRADADLLALGAEFDAAHTSWQSAWRAMTEAQDELYKTRDALAPEARAAAERTIADLEQQESEAFHAVEDLSDAILAPDARTPGGLALECRVFKVWAGSELWDEHGRPQRYADTKDGFIARLIGLISASCAESAGEPQA